MTDFWKKDFSDLIVEQKGSTVWLRLNRPKQRNAYSVAMVESLKKVFIKLKTDSQIHLVFLTGMGKGFCAGGDLNSMQEKSGMFAGDSAELRDHYRQGLQELTKLIWNSDQLTVAVVNGPAAGAGCDLACMCDLRIASEQAFFIEPFTKIGLVPGDGGSYFLPLVVGYARAMHMLMTGEKIDASKALDWGLVSYVTKHEDLEKEAEKWGEKLLKQGKLALGMTKKALKDTISRSLSSHLELLAAFQGITQRDKEHQSFLDSLKQ